MRHRVLSHHRERAVRLSLEQLLVNLPIATVLLDGELRVTSRNRSAIDCAPCGISDRNERRAKKYRDEFRLLTPVLAYCENFKVTWNPCHHRECPLISPDRVYFSHPSNPRCGRR